MLLESLTVNIPKCQGTGKLPYLIRYTCMQTVPAVLLCAYSRKTGLHITFGENDCVLEYPLRYAK